jgi:xanthine dehydrogenase accessory factor
MNSILATVREWRAAGQSVALATVISVQGSAPRREGARMAVSGDGDVVGSVSGGCVENDVITHALEVLKSGQPRLARYDISDDMAWDVGLACGGSIEVWIEPLASSQLQTELEIALRRGSLLAQATLIEGTGRPGDKLLVWPTGKTFGSLGDAALERQAANDARAMMERPRAELRQYAAPAARVFIEVLPPPPHLVIFGGVHIAIPLTDMAKTLGYRVTIADPRRAFANHERFSHADQIITEWPQKVVQQLEIGPTTYCVILTHDPKIDEPALKSLLGQGAAYVGAIGSRKTHAERFARMAQHGVSAEQLAEVYAPVGLNLGAQTPEEIALAIMAEIVAVRRGRTGGFMRSPAPPRSPP